MTNDHWRRGTLTLGIFTVAVPPAAFLTMTAASADEYDFTPDTSTFVPGQAEGFPPLINEVTGKETWSITDLTTNTVKIADLVDGTDTQTTIGSFTNNDFLFTESLTFANPNPDYYLPVGTQFDLANFGLGFENAWIDIPSTGTDPGVADLFITPFGDIPLFGTAFADLTSLLG